MSRPEKSLPKKSKLMMTETQRYRLQMKATSKMLREFFSGVSISILSRRYGYSEKKIRELASAYRQGKIDIFAVTDQKKIAMSELTHKEEIELLQMKIKSLEEALKMANIKAEGYDYMMGVMKEEYGVDLSKKVEAERLRHSKKDTQK
jgi:hypothetical protein